MRRLVLSAFIALSAASAFGASPAAARDYPYCAQGRELGYPGDCSFTNYSQCQASASGRNVSCIVNPRVAFDRARGGRGYGDGVYAPRERIYRRGYRDNS